MDRKQKRQMADHYENKNNEHYSKIVKAGKRTYFFDVKSTKSDDFYLTITESKRKMNGEKASYEKHKIFLYKEDFHKFSSALNHVVSHIKTDLMPDEDFEALEAED